MKRARLLLLRMVVCENVAHRKMVELPVDKDHVHVLVARLENAVLG